VNLKIVADRLKNGETVLFRPHGNSMEPRIKSGQLVTVEPVTVEILNKDDVVLVKVDGKYFLHKISAVNSNQYQISNNRGSVNGWTTRKNIFGVVTQVSP
jgi:phage repressor protein C with HTH and peptisase S24 domain